jgi:hypothetical protein
MEERAMSKFDRDLAAGANHINVKLTGPLSKDGGTFKWALNEDISKAKLVRKKVKDGFDISIAFHVKEKPVRCWACLREEEGKTTTVKHICGKRTSTCGGAEADCICPECM